LPYILVFLVTGVVLVNVTEYFREIVEELDQVGWPLYVLFFLIAGAKLHLESLETVGVLSIVYLISRSLGKIGGVKLVTRFVKKAPGAAREIGWGLLTQAGVAVGLSMLAVEKLPDIGREIESIIVTTVIFFEIAGTILVRFAVVRAGEVKVFALVDRPMASPYSLSFRATARKLMASIGVGPYEKPEHIERLAVHMVMRKNIRSIPVNATFSEIMSFISHSRYNNLPVTSANKLYEGMISYPEVREAIYDPSLSYIMIAKDFARWKDARIHPGAGLMDALEIFHRLDVDCLPVVEDDTGKLVGLLEQREVLRLCGKRRIEGDN
nr:CBS domain-containing protein [FCB group bacterium]